VYTKDYTFKEGATMNLTDMVVWFFRWAWVTLNEAFWNYVYLWIPLALVFVVVRWLLPASTRKRIRAWFDSTSIKYPRM
jgi:hypothetical protein